MSAEGPSGFPVFRAIYGPLKQLTAAFSPDNEFGFKRVVLVEREGRGWALGFLTKEFVVDRREHAGIPDQGLRE